MNSLRNRIAVCLILALSISSSASAQAVGDFNNDGFADLAIGVPNESLNSGLECGAVNVLYGSGGRLTSIGSQFWHLDVVGVAGAAETADHLGRSLAAGDFNGDGFDDLAIGMPGRKIGNQPEAGAVLILLGSGTGLVAVGSKIWDQDTADVRDTPDWNDRFGQSLSSGDYNGDGFDDLAIGIPGEDGEFGLDVGAVAVFYGSLSGLTAIDDQFIQQGDPGIDATAEGGDEFGRTLASGDFNNDGRDDLVVGVPDESFNDQDEAGIAHVLFGTVAGIVTAGSQLWNLDSPGVPQSAQDRDRFGSAFAVGDFNDDGYDDLAIGASAKNFDGKSETGGVLILRGSAAGPVVNGAKVWTQNTGNLLGECRAGDRFGFALAAGDFNGDGFDDLAIGITGENVGGVFQAGAVQVLYGSNDGVRGTGNQLWSQDSTGILDRCETKDRFGSTLVAGDFDDDGFADLAVGVPYENVGASDAGAVAAIYGSGSGLRAGPDQFWTQNTSGVEGECDADDFFGGANIF